MRIDDNTAFSKNGPDAKHKYEVQNYENMFFDNHREASKQCRGTEATLIQRNCEFQIVHHRCRSIEPEFYSKIPEIKVTSIEIDGIEQKLTKWMTNKTLLSKIEINQIFERLGEKLTEIRKLSLVSSDAEFARKALEYRIIGLLQTDMDEIPYLSDKADKAVKTAFTIQTQERGHVPSTPAQVKR